MSLMFGTVYESALSDSLVLCSFAVFCHNVAVGHFLCMFDIYIRVLDIVMKKAKVLPGPHGPIVWR